MRISFRYGAAVGILATAFGMLGPIAVQAGQTPGASVPPAVAAFTIQAPATHLSGMAGRPVVMTAMIKRSASQHGTGIAQRENDGLGAGREQLGLPGLQNRMLQQGYRCGYGYNHCCGYGYNHCCGYGYGGGYGHCCGYGYDGCRHYDHIEHYGALGRSGHLQSDVITRGLMAASPNASRLNMA